MLLEDTVAIVTGGASGIGKAMVRRFADEGADVVVADVDEAGADVDEAGADVGRASAASGAAVTSPTTATSRRPSRPPSSGSAGWTPW